MSAVTSLVNRFDDIVAATDVLVAGSEGGEGILGVITQYEAS